MPLTICSPVRCLIQVRMNFYEDTDGTVHGVESENGSWLVTIRPDNKIVSIEDYIGLPGDIERSY